jgi:hypothetical protein
MTTFRDNVFNFIEDTLGNRVVARLRRNTKPRIGNIEEAIELDDVVVLSQLRRVISEEITKNNNNNGGAGGPEFAFNGNRPITRNGPYRGLVVGGDDIIEFTEKYWFPADVPAISLDIAGGTLREFGANSAVTLVWTVTKTTYALNSIIIDTNSFAPGPSVDNDGDPYGSTQSGTKAASSIPNTNTTFNGQVQAQGGLQSASASVTLNWVNAIYVGNIAKDGKSTGQTITDADILSANGALSPFTPGSGKKLSGSRLQRVDGLDGNGKYPFFAWASSYGNPTFIANGLTTTAWTKVRSNSNFTNSNGYTFPIDVWIGDTVQNSPIGTFEVK